MTQVPKTHENLNKCHCVNCPTYTFMCKIKAAPAIALSFVTDPGKEDHLEKMFCAYGKSNCIEDDKGCICPKCENFKEYKLGKMRFCLAPGGK